MRVKRWSFLAVFGVIMVSMGFVMVISETASKNKTFAAVIIIAGILAIITGIKRIINSFADKSVHQPGGFPQQENFFFCRLGIKIL